MFTTVSEFFKGSEGRWFSQRTNYQLAQTDQWHRSDKTQVFSEFLPQQSEPLVKLCQRYQLDIAQALCGLESRWEKTYFKPAGSTVMIVLGTDPQAKQGTLVWCVTGTEPQRVQYELGRDGALTLTWPQTPQYAQERIWFASPTLRLRTSLTRVVSPAQAALQTFETSLFYSEIRLGDLPEQAASASAAGAQS